MDVEALIRMSIMLPNRGCVYLDVSGDVTRSRRRSRPGRREAYGHALATLMTRSKPPGTEAEVLALSPFGPRCLHKSANVPNSAGFRANSLCPSAINSLFNSSIFFCA